MQIFTSGIATGDRQSSFPIFIAVLGFWTIHDARTCSHEARLNNVDELLANSSARLAGINVGGPARITPSGDFGLIGLAVMGQNLIMNIADHKFTIVAFNRTVARSIDSSRMRLKVC